MPSHTPPRPPAPPRQPPLEQPPLAPGSEHQDVEASGTELPLPHERDESPHQTSDAPDPVIRQAQRDLQEGQVDTDLRGTPGLDAQRRERLLRPPRGGRSG